MSKGEYEVSYSFNAPAWSSFQLSSFLFHVMSLVVTHLPTHLLTHKSLLLVLCCLHCCPSLLMSILSVSKPLGLQLFCHSAQGLKILLPLCDSPHCWSHLRGRSIGNRDRDRSSGNLHTCGINKFFFMLCSVWGRLAPIVVTSRCAVDAPKIALRFLCLYHSLCVCTYHVCNNYVTYIVAMRP